MRASSQGPAAAPGTMQAPVWWLPAPPNVEPERDQSRHQAGLSEFRQIRFEPCAEQHQYYAYLGKRRNVGVIEREEIVRRNKQPPDSLTYKYARQDTAKNLRQTEFAH